MEQNPERLSDCCKAKIYEEVGMEKCSKCKRLCYSDPATLEVNVHDTIRAKEHLDGGGS